MKNILLKKLIFPVSIVFLFFGLTTFSVFALDENRITINGKSLVDFTQFPLSANEAGDLTLIDQNTFKLYFYPAENFFFVALDQPTDYQKIISPILEFLKITKKDLCELPFKISTTTETEPILLCQSSARFDLDANGKWDKFDVNFFASHFKTKGIYSTDINFDNQVNSLDFSLLYDFIFNQRNISP